MQEIFDKEAIEVATLFSENYKTLDIGGNYCSQNGKYLICMSDISDNTPARVSLERIDGCVEVEFNKPLIDSIKSYNNEDFIFWLSLWCICGYDTDDFMECDTKTMQYYITTNRSIKGVYDGFYEVFKTQVPTEQNKERLNNINNKFNL